MPHSIAEKVATELLRKGRYLDVDLHADNRARFGIPPIQNRHTPIDPYESTNGDFVQPEDYEGQKRREELWVSRVKGQSLDWALLISGYLHTLESFFPAAVGRS
jgi:hypothetical protein